MPTNLLSIQGLARLVLPKSRLISYMKGDFDYSGASRGMTSQLKIIYFILFLLY